MPKPRSLRKTRLWLGQIEEDRQDYELVTQVVSAGEPIYSLEEVIQRLNDKSRTRHRKPRKIY
jgi:hypothetical protein